MFATHFHEISERDEILSMKNLALKHMTVRYDQISQELVYDRKLQDGPGKSLYGLEVCKFLRFPDELEILKLQQEGNNDYSSGIIQIKSTSRFGQYDFGVNRRRVGVILAKLDHF